MMNIERPSNGGRPIMYRYDPSGPTFVSISPSILNATDFLPPSLFDPTLVNGLYDQAFVVIKEAVPFYSHTEFEVGASNHFWTFMDNLGAQIAGVISCNSLVMKVTNIEYINTDSTNTYVYIGIYLDIYAE